MPYKRFPIYLFKEDGSTEDIEETVLKDLSETEDLFGEHLLKHPNVIVEQFNNLNPIPHIKVMRLLAMQMEKNMYDPNDKTLLENLKNIMIESCKVAIWPCYFGYIAYVDMIERNSDTFKMFTKFHKNLMKNSRDYMDLVFDPIVQEARQCLDKAVEFGGQYFSHSAPKENRDDEDRE